jgi:hypothetical protein
MITLNDYIGSLVSSVADARAQADMQTVRIAEAYAAHPLLKHFSVPRMRIGDVELSVPIGIQNLATKSEWQLDPIGNEQYKAGVYVAAVRSANVDELLPAASGALKNLIATQMLPQALEFARNNDLDSTWGKPANLLLEGFFRIAEEYDLYKQQPGFKIDSGRTFDAIYNFGKNNIKGVVEKPVLGGLGIVAESSALREMRPEDLLRIKVKISEDGMEWNVTQRDDGTVDRRLLPE